MRKRSRATDLGSVSEAIGYIRVSTQEQAVSGLGLEAQKTRIAAYCLAQGWSLAETLADAGVSGKTLDRPALKEAIAKMRPGRVLLALKLDRLTRTAADLDALTRAIEKRQGAWACVEGQYDTSNAMGRFLIRIIADIAQLEREQTGDRTSAALQEKRTRRERLGTDPLGYRTVENAGVKSVVVVPSELETVQMARDLRADGKSFRDIASALRAADRRTKRGGQWHANTIKKLLETRYIEELLNDGAVVGAYPEGTTCDDRDR